MTTALKNYGLSTYPTFITFTPREVEQPILIYMMNVLSPLPQVETKLSLRSKGTINGNNLIRSVFGSNVISHHR